jgi:hypothetical protein
MFRFVIIVYTHTSSNLVLFSMTYGFKGKILVQLTLNLFFIFYLNNEVFNALLTQLTAGFVQFIIIISNHVIVYFLKHCFETLETCYIKGL